MRQLILLLSLLGLGLFSSCQCADKPDVPPIDNSAVAGEPQVERLS